MQPVKQYVSFKLIMEEILINLLIMKLMRFDGVHDC